jgi:hypothetical protein
LVGGPEFKAENSFNFSSALTFTLGVPCSNVSQLSEAGSDFDLGCWLDHIHNCLNTDSRLREMNPTAG